MTSLTQRRRRDGRRRHGCVVQTSGRTGRLGLAGEVLPRRAIDPDGTPVDVFPLPTDSASLEALLRDLFENHWREITFGPIIQGAAWQMRADRAPPFVIQCALSF
jgi:hypothetical protein